LSSVRILLVDDEEEFVETLAERLNFRGHVAIVALNGKKALEILENKNPDVVVLDLNMPGIDGMSLLKMIKKGFSNVEVIMLTAHGSKISEAVARDLGVFEYLQKPVDIETIINKVKLAYENKIEKSMF